MICMGPLTAALLTCVFSLIWYYLDIRRDMYEQTDQEADWAYNRIY